jgi:hypothetical protein
MKRTRKTQYVETGPQSLKGISSKRSSMNYSRHVGEILLVRPLLQCFDQRRRNRKPAGWAH